MSRSIKTVERRSPHHALLVRLQLDSVAYDASNGAEFTRHMLSANHFMFGNRSKALHGKLKEQLLTPLGYELIETRDGLTPSGLLSTLTYTYAKGEDVIRIYAYATSDFHAEERVVHVDHFPLGTASTNQGTVTIDQIINTMSWGMASAA